MKFDFWKHNKLDQHYQVDAETITTRFKEWMDSDDEHYLALKSWRFDRLFRMFLSTVFESVWEESQYDTMLNAVYEEVATGEFWGKVENATGRRLEA